MKRAFSWRFLRGQRILVWLERLKCSRSTSSSQIISNFSFRSNFHTAEESEREKKSLVKRNRNLSSSIILKRFFFRRFNAEAIEVKFIFVFVSSFAPQPPPSTSSGGEHLHLSDFKAAAIN
jgi:hypothetical protein